MISWFSNIVFLYPWVLALLALIPLFAYWAYKKRAERQVTLKMSSIGSNTSELQNWKTRIWWLLPLLKALAFAGVIIALARPQHTLKEEEIKAEGIDIMLVMDLSSSMLARDFKPDRLEVSKRVAGDFISKRPHDRIGMVVFAGEAFTQCPLTTDHGVLKEFLGGIRCGFLEDGTAIGMGLATAVNRIKDSEAKSKVVILLTDGVNNAGYVKPITAAEIAREFGVKLYAIGMGSTGQALTPISRMSNGSYKFGMARVEIDEALLNQMSDMTGGKYFRATSEQMLEKIYEFIDRMEKTEIEVTAIKRYSEEFRQFLLFGMACLLMHLIFKFTLFRSLP